MIECERHTRIHIALWETPIPLSGYCKSYCTIRPLLLCALVCLEMFCRLHGLTDDQHNRNNLHHPDDDADGKELHDIKNDVFIAVA